MRRELPRHWRQGLMLTVALLGSTGLQAQALDLSQAYGAALDQSASLRAARAAAASGREVLPQAKAQLLPNVTASVTYSQVDQDTSTGGVAATDRYLNSGQSLVIRQPLYRPLQMTRYEQARVQLRQVESTFDREVQDLAIKVAETYFEVLLSEDRVAVVQVQKKTYAAQLDAATRSMAAGSGIRTDIDEAQARLDMSLAQELEARQHLQLAMQQMRTLVTQPFDRLQPLDVSRLTLGAPQPESLAEWIRIAEDRSPELLQLSAQHEAAALEIDKARSGHRPTLDAYAQWSRNQGDNALRPQTRTTARTVGLQLAIPIYAGGGVDSSVRQAIADHLRLEESLEAARRELGLRVHREFRGVTEGLLRIKALEQAVRSAEQLVRSQRRAYVAGSRTTIDILNAEQQHASAVLDLAQARYVHLLSHIRLQAAAGVLDAQRLTQINAFLATTPVAAIAPPSGGVDRSP